MNELDELKKEVADIKTRNARVEQDKSWEISSTRKVTIAILTYIVIVLFFFVSKLGNPFINAIIPTLGFLLSTLSISIFKNWWIKWNK